jgi:hypothetical protein
MWIILTLKLDLKKIVRTLSFPLLRIFLEQDRQKISRERFGKKTVMNRQGVANASRIKG